MLVIPIGGGGGTGTGGTVAGLRRFDTGPHGATAGVLLLSDSLCVDDMIHESVFGPWSEPSSVATGRS